MASGMEGGLLGWMEGGGVDGGDGWMEGGWLDGGWGDGGGLRRVDGKGVGG